MLMSGVFLLFLCANAYCAGTIEKRATISLIVSARKLTTLLWKSVRSR